MKDPEVEPSTGVLGTLHSRFSDAGSCLCLQTAWHGHSLYSIFLCLSLFFSTSSSLSLKHLIATVKLSSILPLVITLGLLKSLLVNKALLLKIPHNEAKALRNEKPVYTR